MMSFDKLNEDYLAALYEETGEFLFKLIQIPSISGSELAASEFCYKRFSAIPGVLVEKQYLSDSLVDDPLWSSGPYPFNGYSGRFNVIAVWKGWGTQAPVYVNAHVDTVAACSACLMPPCIDGDTIYGLGAHDDKGHVAAIYTLFRLLSKNRVSLPFDVIAHIVVEEEIGGNGTLAAVRASEKGQAAIILDGCSGVIANACRGAIWPRVICTGDSCHPSDRDRVNFFSAYDRLKIALANITALHNEYCAEIYKNPVEYFEGLVPPLNVGAIHAGNWPSTIPTEAYADIVFGVFPGYTNYDIKKRLENAISADERLAGFCRIEFIFDVDAGVTDIDDPLIMQLHDAAVSSGLSGKVQAFNGACDIGYYRNLMGVPSANIGIGEPNAHSKHECIDISDSLRLGDTVYRWCHLRANL